ncbi:MAG: zinc-ribbon domain-containing protein, partial [bacterium]
MYCPQCGQQVKENSKFCASCGSQIIEEKNELSVEKNNDFNIKNNDLDSKNNISSGWNWFGFLFGPLWYLYRGMIKKGIIIFIIGMIGASII